METLIYFAILVILAEILGTIGGFGSSVFFVPIAALFFDFHSVLGLTALFHLASNLSKISLFRNGVEWSIILRMGIPAITLVVVGALLAKYVDNRQLEIWFSLFMILLSLAFIFKPTLKIEPNNTNTIAGGALSGFIAGILGSGGMIRGLVLSGFDLEIEVFIATSAMIDLGIDASRSIVYFQNGFMHRDDMYLVPILALISYVGTWLGKLLLKRLNKEQFKKIVLFLILAIGVYTLYRGVTL